MSTVLAWVLAASSLLAPHRQHDRLAQAIAARVEAEEPLFKDDADRMKTAALLVAMAFRESSLRADVVGDHVNGKPTSFCAFQIHLPWGRKTAEGWSGADLIGDPEKCVAVAMRYVRESMRACAAHPIAVYASGPDGCKDERAQRISRDRVALAKRLIRKVKVQEEPKPSPRTTSRSRLRAPTARVSARAASPSPRGRIRAADTGWSAR